MWNGSLSPNVPGVGSANKACSLHVYVAVTGRCPLGADKHSICWATAGGGMSTTSTAYTSYGAE